MIDFTTFGGDSGGPVFIADPRHSGCEDDERPLVLGIVVSQLRHDEKLVIMNEERTVHHPMNLSTVVDAQFVRETIEQLRK